MTLKILVVGAGAVGGYFGARLAEAGRDVTFLVHPKPADALRADGLQVKSPHGDLTIRPQLLLADGIGAPFDLIFLSVKGYALDAAMDDFAPAVGPDTMILPVLNGMAHMDRLQARFGRGALLGGACRIFAELKDGVVLQHAPLQQIAYGELDGSVGGRVEALDSAMQDVGFDAALSTHIVQDMWDKWVQLASLGAATCLMRGVIGEIVAAPGGSDTALGLLQEAVSIAGACGHPPSEAFVSRATATLSEQGSKLASSMYRDLKAGARVEVDTILADLLERGRRLSVPAPLLKAATSQLAIYSAGLKT